MIIVTLTMVGLAGYLIVSDARQRRELAGFREKLAARARPEWHAYTGPLPVEE